MSDPPGARAAAGYIADTSVFVAAEQRRELGEPPAGDGRISVATLTELAVGIARAQDAALARVRRLTLDRAQRFIALPYDDAVAYELARILAAAREHRRRTGAMDAIIAATALTHGLTVWTQDDDFEVLAMLAPDLAVVRG